MSTASHFLISATSSGSGKTTVTLGLLRALKNRGLDTQPFKCGPDYIDIKYHDLAAKSNSINLDLFLSSENHVIDLYHKYNAKKDICVTEGVMGLFDGYNRMDGSSAQIAKLLNIPVILVINAKSMAYSAAAMLYGFKNFYKDINVVGVIFNFVSTESHYYFLKEACADVGIEALGYLPKQTEIEIPSRHLGLNIDSEFIFDHFAEKVATLAETHIDIDRLLEITKRESPTTYTAPIANVKDKELHIAVAYDNAFNFIYQENIEYLKRFGIVSFFSPIQDKELPKADLVYLPGGYPELYLEQLSNNKSMIQSIRDYIESNGKLLAECGGMMYLCSSIIDKDSTEYPMVDIFKQKASMQQMKLKLGYRSFEYNEQLIKGHEFHYSTIDNKNEIVSQTTIYNAKGIEVDTKLFRYKNTIAGYTHMYWPEINIFKLFN